MHTRIAQITDLHLLSPGNMLMDIDVNARLQSVLDHASENNPDAYFLTGDFCAQDPVQEIYHQLRPLLDALGKPYYITPGNHDDRGMLRNAFYLDGHNDEPIKGLVRVNNLDFLFIDSAHGVVDKEQLVWLRKAITLYPRAAIVMHHPPVPMGVRFMDNKYPLRETEDLLHILTSDGRRRRIFCGHFHTSRTVEHENLQVHLCPPTSFFIKPTADDFEQVILPPAYLMLEWTEGGDFRAVPTYVP
ncbi:metallophosphoesterase [Neolewinella persica]|uniref:metallophosphoesterase n=1 Tax=Neolewinella persica TaxID=70998 RepID=UPI0008FBEDA4|nr:metallophosphoesterase [Neolewinella persica]